MTSGVTMSSDGGIQLTLFIQACRLSEVEEAKKCLEVQPSLITQTFLKGSTSIHVAAGFGCHQLLPMLVEGGVDVNAKNEPEGMTALHVAAREPKCIRALVALLELGADVSSRDAKGQTALHVASKSGNIAAVKVLVDHSARTDVKDTEGLTATDVAKDDGTREALQGNDSIITQSALAAAEKLADQPPTGEFSRWKARCLKSAAGGSSSSSRPSVASKTRSPSARPTKEKKARPCPTCKGKGKLEGRTLKCAICRGTGYK